MHFLHLHVIKLRDTCGGGVMDVKNVHSWTWRFKEAELKDCIIGIPVDINTPKTCSQWMWNLEGGLKNLLCLRENYVKKWLELFHLPLLSFSVSPFILFLYYFLSSFLSVFNFNTLISTIYCYCSFHVLPFLLSSGRASNTYFTFLRLFILIGWPLPY